MGMVKRRSFLAGLGAIGSIFGLGIEAKAKPPAVIIVNGILPGDTVAIIQEDTGEMIFSEYAKNEQISIPSPSAGTVITCRVRRPGIRSFQQKGITIGDDGVTITAVRTVDSLFSKGETLSLGISWGSPNQILINDTDVAIPALYRTIRYLEAIPSSMKHESVITAAYGGEDLGNGIKVGTSIVLEDTEIIMNGVTLHSGNLSCKNI